MRVFRMGNVLLWLLFVLFLGAAQGSPLTPGFQRMLSSYVDATVKCRHVPGLTLAVVNGDDTWSKGFGKADLDSGKTVTPATLFGIGSLTKSFTMTLLAKLLKKQGFNWKSKVTDILGKDFEFVDEVRTNKTMLRDILSHRTGLAAMGFGHVAGYPDTMNRGNLCSRMRYQPAQIPFRDAFIYNNYMFMLAGHVSEVLGNASWERLVKSEILDPIGMRSTRILKEPSDVLKNDAARPYFLHNDVFVNGSKEIYKITPLEPAGALLSSAEDMAKWLKFHLKQGMTEDGTQLVDKKLLQEAKTAHITLPRVSRPDNPLVSRPFYPVDDTDVGYGYGLDISSYRGYRVVAHSGGLGAYISLMWWFPDMNAGIFASSSGPGNSNAMMALRSIFYYVSDHLLGAAPWLNETTSCSFPKPWQNLDKNDTTHTTDAPGQASVQYSSYGDYEGLYGNRFLPDVHVVGNGSDLTLVMKAVSGVLHPTPEKDKFKIETTRPIEYQNKVIDAPMIQVNFTRNGAGDHVTGFDIGLDVPMSYEKGVSIVDFQVPSSGDTA